LADFRAAVCSLSLLMMQSLSQHSQQLIKQAGETQAIEEEKFRLSVAPVARSLSALLKDLEEVLYSMPGAESIHPSL
jgi:hypothetical protein